MLFKIKVSWANILFTEYFTHAMFHGNEISTCFARRTVYLLQLENMLCLRRDLPWYYKTRGICYTWGERGISRSRKKVKLFLYLYSFLLWSMSNVDKNNNGLNNALSTHIWVYLTGYYGTCYTQTHLVEWSYYYINIKPWFEIHLYTTFNEYTVLCKNRARVSNDSSSRLFAHSRT